MLTVDEDVLRMYEGRVPRHVAFIMDGNGRWARERGMPRLKGHHAGAESVRRVMESCRYLGVEAVTLYAFSSENWGRPEDEVRGLMALFDLYIKKERKRLIDNGIAMRVIGARDKLPEKLQNAIEELERATAVGRDMVLQIAVSYGGRDELVRAMRSLAYDVEAGRLKASQIDEAVVESRLYTAGLPDPDLLVRTSGELRISNFLLWQIAYSEIYVTKTYWPDFDELALVAALRDFDARQRRFGKTGAQLEEDQS